MVLVSLTTCLHAVYLTTVRKYNQALSLPCGHFLATYCRLLKFSDSPKHSQVGENMLMLGTPGSFSPFIILSMQDVHSLDRGNVKYAKFKEIQWKWDCTNNTDWFCITLCWFFKVFTHWVARLSVLVSTPFDESRSVLVSTASKSLSLNESWSRHPQNF